MQNKLWLRRLAAVSVVFTFAVSAPAGAVYDQNGRLVGYLITVDGKVYY